MSEYLAETFKLSGQVAALTGGGGVLCSTLAGALAIAGAKVVVLDLFEDAAQRAAEAITADGGEAIAVKCDVLDRESVQAAFDKAIETYGQVDILVNGAGGNKKEATTGDDMPFFDLPPDAMRWVFDLNFIGSFLPSQVFGKHFAERGTGQILNISSMNAFRPLTKIPAYSAAKSAISNFTQWLAVHMNQNYSKDIRVNAIAPGFFLTAQNRFLLTDEKSGDLTARGEQIIGHTPMGRFGDPEDLVGTVLWILSPGAAFVNGVVVPIDGGFSAYSGV